ncbi:uncharacterized protein V1510DRAFT_414262 [Dipodascopsis tothii]|uniref:uncharacterized protein n=1 Tax=Dipodascopsis tothii TaxID=44089 RepID=UPI0034CD3C46
MASTFDIIGNLPIDIVPNIVAYVPRYTDLIKFQQVSRAWRHIFTNPVTYATIARPAGVDNLANDYADESAIDSSIGCYSRFLEKCYSQHAVLTLNLSDTHKFTVPETITTQVAASAYSTEFLVLYLRGSHSFLVWDFAAPTLEPYAIQLGSTRVSQLFVSDQGGFLVWREQEQAGLFVYHLRGRAAAAMEPSASAASAGSAVSAAASLFDAPSPASSASSAGSPGPAPAPAARDPSGFVDRTDKALLDVYPFPPLCRPAGINPFSCDGQHLVCRFEVVTGSPKKFVHVWDVVSRELISSFPYSDSGLWETSGILADKKIYLFSIPPKAEELNMMFPFPGFCKIYDLEGNVKSMIGVLPGTEFKFNRIFQPACRDGKMSYCIFRQGFQGISLSTMTIDENTGVGKEQKFHPAIVQAEVDKYDNFYPVQEAISQADSRCVYAFHAMSADNAISGEMEVWDTLHNTSRKYEMPNVRAVFGNESFFCKFVNRDLIVHRYRGYHERPVPVA